MKRPRMLMAASVVIPICVAGYSVQADDAGAFIGGIVAAKVLDNMQRRTAAAEAQAYQPSRSPAPTYSPPPASQTSTRTAEDKLQQLDRLAAGGYITPQEYKARRKAILDSM